MDKLQPIIINKVNIVIGNITNFSNFIFRGKKQSIIIKVFFSQLIIYSSKKYAPTIVPTGIQNILMISDCHYKLIGILFLLFIARSEVIKSINKTATTIKPIKSPANFQQCRQYCFRCELL